MKIVTFAPLCVAIVGMALAQPALAQRAGLADTGSMDYPAPLPQGKLGTTAVTSPDRVALTRSNRPTGAGSVAYPAAASAGVGNSGTR